MILERFRKELELEDIQTKPIEVCIAGYIDFEQLQLACKEAIKTDLIPVNMIPFRVWSVRVYKSNNKPYGFWFGGNP
jgi:hypothetical protein